MTAKTSKKHHSGTSILSVVLSLLYLGLLVLFGYQTWMFVSWLFPDDQFLMKLLTLISFDVLSLLWACTDLFWKFADREARTLVRSAWALTFFLSLAASILYLVIESMFRFQVPISPITVDIGYGVSIFALTANILFLTFFLYKEYRARHPEDFEEDEELTPDSMSHNGTGQPTRILTKNGLPPR